MTPPTLTPRLMRIAEQIRPCTCVADIGTDHAYLPTYLCMTQKAKHAIASDIRQGPLRRAESTLHRYGTEGQIETRLGGGASSLAVGEAECIVIAGMGGLMIQNILSESPQIFAAAEQILLQPMTALYELRQFLSQEGYTIANEVLAKEDSKLYHILAVTAHPDPTVYTDAELCFGKHLLEGTDPHRTEYLQKQRRKLQKTADGLKLSQTPANAERLQHTLALLNALNEYE